MNLEHRRSFLRKTSLFATSALLTSVAAPAWAKNLERAIKKTEDISADLLASDEDFWSYIQQSFTTSPGIMNLNNAGVSPAPKPVQDAMKRYFDLSNEAPSYYMWRILDQGREPLRANLAKLAGCSAEEIAINRNASEGLETVIFGLQLKAGDEVVATKQDYPNVVNAFKQRAKRDGIKINWISLDLPSENEDYLVRQFVKAFTPKTKLVHITHVINWTGQILPVKRIAQEARKRGIEVSVDGAHSFAQLDFNIPDLEADYFSASLHKWLYAPIGTGVMYIKKDKIKNIYPLFATGDDPLRDDIRKFETLGTRPFYIEQAIGQAIAFHEMIGAERKQKRLHYLKNYWMEKVQSLPGIRFNSSLHPQWGCAIGSIAINGAKPGELEGFLFDKYKIHVSNSNWENLTGARITPNVYTSTKNLDVLVQAINEFVKKK